MALPLKITPVFEGGLDGGFAGGFELVLAGFAMTLSEPHPLIKPAIVQTMIPAKMARRREMDLMEDKLLNRITATIDYGKAW
jgi:hypothetical protein